MNISLLKRIRQNDNCVLIKEPKYSEFEKGYNAALGNAIMYLYNNLMYVPEDDNPHVEGCKIENLSEFINDFIKTLKNGMLDTQK